MGFWGWTVTIIGIFVVIGAIIESFKQSNREVEEAAAHGVSAADVLTWGPLNEHLVCPHCQNKSCVLTKQVTQKKGVSGAKATGALLTGGISLVATGLSRKEGATQAHCSICSSTWHF